MNHGERLLQDRLGTRERADAFEARQTLRHLNDRMRHFIGRQEMMFLATADANGACDSTFRAGPPGFVRVLDTGHLTWPEYRGNGVMASLGNLAENPHVGLLFIDFDEVIGLHVNGTAEIVEDPDDQLGTPPGQRARLWVIARVHEAYIHCAKHIPHLVKGPRQRNRQPGAEQPKKSDYFVPPPPTGGRRPVIPAQRSEGRPVIPAQRSEGRPVIPAQRGEGRPVIPAQRGEGRPAIPPQGRPGSPIPEASAQDHR